MNSEIFITAALGLFGWSILETHKNTVAIMALKVELAHLAEKLAPVGKMQRDLDVLHKWRRDLTDLEDDNDEE